jgi:hypothetical protein
MKHDRPQPLDIWTKAPAGLALSVMAHIVMLVATAVGLPGVISDVFLWPSRFLLPESLRSAREFPAPLVALSLSIVLYAVVLALILRLVGRDTA